MGLAAGYKVRFKISSSFLSDSIMVAKANRGTEQFAQCHCVAHNVARSRTVIHPHLSSMVGCGGGLELLIQGGTVFERYVVAKREDSAKRVGDHS